MAAYFGYFIARLGQNLVAFVQSLYVVHLLGQWYALYLQRFQASIVYFTQFSLQLNWMTAFLK